MIRRTTTQSWWPILLLAGVVGPPLGWLVHFTAAQAERARDLEPFRDLVAEKAFRLEKEVLALANVVRSVQAFERASERVTRDEFETFTTDPLERLPAILAVEWAPRVDDAGRAAHEAATRSEGFADYRIREPRLEGAPVPAGVRADYYPVHFIEPLQGNESALGLDLAFEGTRRAALEDAALTGEPVLSDPIRLVQGRPAEVGFLLCQAVRSTEDDELSGFVVVALTAPGLLCASELVCEGRGSDLFLSRLVDLDGPRGEEVLFEDDAYPHGEPEEVVRTFEVGGQTWAFSAVPTEAYWAGRRSLQPFLLGLATLVSWIGLVGSLGLFVRRVQERTLARQSRTIRSVLAALTDGVVVSDPQGDIVYANDAARAIVGNRASTTPPEGWARACGFFLPDGLTPYPEDDLPLSRTLRGEHVPETEVFLRNDRHPHGAWLTIDGSPLTDRRGALQGGVVVLRDVTERRRFQAQRFEMELAALVQRNLYPLGTPSIEGFEVAGDVVSAEATCGDYYDFIPLPDGRTALVIGDVSGHGLGPALVMGQVRAYLRSTACTTTDPEQILARVNQLLTPDLKESLFVTLLVVCVDPHTDHLVYASAGHTPAYVLAPDGTVRHELVRTGIPLGIQGRSTYARSRTPALEPGDTLLMITDGVTESRSPSGRFLNEAGLLDLVRPALDQPAPRVLERLKAGLDAFRQGRPPDDDVTMIVARRVGAGVRLRQEEATAASHAADSQAAASRP